MIKKYYLIYYYHDTYFCEFYRKFELDNYLNSLKQEYKNDNDFSYRIIYGEDILEEMK